MYPTRSWPFAKTECAIKLNNTSCQWRIDTDPPYRLSPAKFLFVLVSYNTFGEISQRFFVDHYEVVIPSPPQEFSLSGVTSTTISVKWEPPEYAEHDDNVRQHLKYQLQYRPIFDHDYLLSSHLRSNRFIVLNVGNVLESTLTGLFSNVNYMILIRCRVANGTAEEKWSKFAASKLTTRTQED
ncbi:cytokine receptor-like protein, partial [Leptotrombidium deliense]